MRASFKTGRLITLNVRESESARNLGARGVGRRESGGRGSGGKGGSSGKEGKGGR